MFRKVFKGSEMDIQTRNKNKGKKILFTINPVKKCGSIIYFIGLILAFYFILREWPESAQGFSLVILVIVFGTMLIQCIQRNYASYKQGKCSKRNFLKRTGVELGKLVFTAVAAIYLAGISARFIGQLVGTAVEIRRPGLGLSAGLLSGISAAVLVGLCVSYLVRIIWAPITKKIS